MHESFFKNWKGKFFINQTYVSLVSVKCLDFNVELLFQLTAVNIVDVKDAIQSILEETRDRRLKINLKRKANITLKDKDFLIQMMKNYNLVMNMMIGTSLEKSFLTLSRISHIATCSCLVLVSPSDNLVTFLVDLLNLLLKPQHLAKEVNQKEEVEEKVND